MRSTPSKHTGAGQESESGMVTVEVALTIGIVTIVVAMLLAGLSVVGKQSQVCTAARESARAYSIGQDPIAAAQAVNEQVQIDVTNQGATVSVTGSVPGISFGELNLGNVQCQVATINEQNMTS